MIPIIYVPLLMITHVAAFYLLLRPTKRQAGALAPAVAEAPMKATDPYVR